MTINYSVNGLSFSKHPLLSAPQKQDISRFYFIPHNGGYIKLISYHHLFIMPRQTLTWGRFMASSSEQPREQQSSHHAGTPSEQPPQQLSKSKDITVSSEQNPTVRVYLRPGRHFLRVRRGGNIVGGCSDDTTKRDNINMQGAALTAGDTK